MLTTCQELEGDPGKTANKFFCGSDDLVFVALPHVDLGGCCPLALAEFSKGTLGGFKDRAAENER